MTTTCRPNPDWSPSPGAGAAGNCSRPGWRHALRESWQSALTVNGGIALGLAICLFLYVTHGWGAALLAASNGAH